MLPARRIESRGPRPGNHRIARDDMQVEGGAWEARWCFRGETHRRRWLMPSPVPEEDHPAFPKSVASVAHESPGGVRPLDCNRFSLFPSILPRIAASIGRGARPPAIDALVRHVGARENRISVRFQYEWHDDSGNWFRAHGNEQWEFDDNGLMRRREASINDVPIQVTDRKFFWPAGPRPADHPGLTELGL